MTTKNKETKRYIFAKHKRDRKNCPS